MAFFVLGVSRSAPGQTDGDWNVNANGNWSTGSNWSIEAGDPGVYPDGIDAIANILFQISASRTITIDGGVPGSTVTLGTLNIGDLSGGSSYTISGGTIVFDVTTGNAQLNMVNDGGNVTINSNIVLNDTLNVTVDDPSNNQGIILGGVISGGTNGTVTMTFDNPSLAANRVNWLLLRGANTFEGQLVVNSGLVRFETSNDAAGARGVGNESIAQNGGTMDLRNRDLNLQADDTEIFMISGGGTNGVGALRNTSGTATISHLILTDDATVGGYSTTTVNRHLNLAGAEQIAGIVDLGGNTFTKLGTGEWRFHNADIRNRAGAVINIFEGELKFENNGGLLGGALIDGTTYGNNLDGLVINVMYNKNPFDGIDPANGTRTFDPFNPPSTHTGLTGNSISNARISFGTYWSGTNTHALHTKVTDVYDNFVVNMDHGTWQREGSTSTGQMFDQIFGPNVTINLVGGGISGDATGPGNLFDISGGSANYNSTNLSFDHPGATEIQGQIDNTSPGNEGTGFTVRGNRELRITSNQTAFDGDIVVKQPTGRWITNSFSTSDGGHAASEYTNLSLAGANGSLNLASSIQLTRWGSLALNNNSTDPVYASANNNDRLNDLGILNLRNGFLKLQTDSVVTNTENFGHVQANFGTNYLVLDTRAGGQFDGSFASLTRTNGGVLKIYDTNPTHVFGTGVTDDRLFIADTSGIVTVGSGAAGTSSAAVVLGVFGGVLPTLSTPSISSHTRPLETVQGSYMYSGAGMGLMTLDGGYLRPLTAAEYDTGLAPAAGTNWLLQGYISPTGGNYGDKNNYASRNVTADTAINSLTISYNETASGQAIPTSAKDYLIIENGKTLRIDSGIINLVNFVEANSANLETIIRGGQIDMNGGQALINSNAIWHDLDRNTGNWYEVMTGNSSFIRTHITNVTDLIKTGRDSLYLETWNDFTGDIFLSEQGSLVVRHAGALGTGAPGREVHIGGGASFLLEYGTNIDGIDVRVSNTTQGSATVLRAEGTTHSTWGGDVILDVADDYGTTNFQSYTITARNNGTLSLRGNVYTANNQNFSDSDSFSDPPVVTTSIGETYTLNLRGQFRDVATGNIGTQPGNENITSIYRTGDSATRLDANHSLRFQMTGHDEGNVNAFQQWDATGRIDLRQGYFRVLYDPSTAAGSGGFYTDGARSLITANDYYTRLVLGADGTSTTNAYHAHLFLTQDGQVMNAPYIYAYNDNRNGTLTIGGENESGTVYYGSSDNSVNFSLQFANQTSERDVRFLQVRGGTLVWNGRFDDENSTATSFNASVSVVGPGTVVFNRNAIGNSDIDRWNFMGGEAHWGTMTGNNQFASTSASANVGVSTWGGGGLVLDAQGSARTQTLQGNIWLLSGASYINTQNNTTLTLGTTARTLTRRSGSSLAFLEDGNGAVNISATGMSTTAGDFLGSWAVYGSTATGVTDWAARASTSSNAGVQAFTDYTDNTFGSGVHTNVTANAALAGSDNAASVRFAAAATLDVGAGNTLTVDTGGILVSAAVAGNVGINNGSLTAGILADQNDLMVHNHGSGSTVITSVITDNGNKVNLVNAGDGVTVLSGENTYTGDTYLNGGVLQISSDSNLGQVNGSIAQVIRVSSGSNNGASVTGRALTFTTDVASVSGATGTYNTNSTQNVSSLSLTDGGSGYTSGVHVTTDVNQDGTLSGDGNAAIRAILDSGNLHFNGGTLHVTETMTLNGGRTIFLGGNGGTIRVDENKDFTINGYISSEFSHVTTDNGFTSSNQIGTDWQPASDRNPDIGDLIIEGGGMVTLTGAPDGVVRATQYNSYGGITWINDGILRIASAGSTSSGILGTNRSWVDGTIIGANGTLLFNTTSDVSLTEWITFRGQGHNGRGTLQSQGTARAYRLAGQLYLEEDVVINSKNGSSFRFNDGGGAMYGLADIYRIGNGALLIYGNSPDWTGSIYNAAGDFYMTSASNLQGMSGLTLERNSLYYHDAGSTSIDEFRDRLPDDLPIFTDGYARIRLRPTGGVFSGEERAGVVTVQGGQLGLEFDLGSDLIGGAPRLTGDYGVWHFQAINRDAGTVVHLRSLDAGTEFAHSGFLTTQFQNVAGVRVDVAPITVGTGDGSNGNAAVVQGFFGGVRRAWINAAGTGNVFSEDRISNRLIKVDTTSGGDHYLRPLMDSEYKRVSSSGATQNTLVDIADMGISQDQNLMVVGVEDDQLGSNEFTNRRNSYLMLGKQDELTVNSLSFESETYVNGSGSGRGNWTVLTMAANQELTINSGMVVYSNVGIQNMNGAAQNTGVNMDIRTSLNGGSLNFNGQDAIFNINGLWVHYNTLDAPNAYQSTDGDNLLLYLNSSIKNAGDFIKTGSTSLFIQSANYYTGDTYVNQGLIYARNDYALGTGDTVFVEGGGGFVVSHGSNITGKNVYIGKINGNNLGMAMQEGASWGGDVIVDNVDVAGGTSYSRNFTARVYQDQAYRSAITGNIYGGDTPIGPSGRTDSRMLSMYDTSNGILDLRGRISDKASGAIAGPITEANQNEVLRLEIVNSNEGAVQLWQQYDAAGRIRLLQTSLVYMGTGNFYTDAAAAAVNGSLGNPMTGFQMGGRSVLASDGSANDDLAFFLAHGGSTFNLASWEVGVETHDPNNFSGNDNFNRGNVTGNSTLGGLDTSGTMNFGTGTGAITFTDMTRFAAYTRDLRLYSVEDATVNINAALLDGGSGVASSITKIGSGTVNLNGSSAGDSTMEGVNVLGGVLNLTGYDVNANRRVGNGAALTLGGGILLMDGSAASFTENFGSLKLNEGGNAIAAAGNGVGNLGTISIGGTAITRGAAGTIHFQSIAGGVVNFSDAAMQNVARIGSYATFGANFAEEAFATDWAATDGSGNVVAFTGYAVDTFAAASHTDVQGTGLAADTTESVRFNNAAGTITSGTLTLNDGGMLFTSNHAGGVAIGAGVNVTTAASGTDLLIHNFATGDVSFDGNIIGSQNVVFSGTGTLAMIAPSTVDSTVASTTTVNNSYTVTVADTSLFTVGQEVTGTNIPDGARVVSITNATQLVLSLKATGAGTADATYSTTVYTPTNTYTGATHVTGAATVSFNHTGAFGATSEFFLNGGTLEYAEVDEQSAALTQHITLGGANGTLSVTDADSILVIRGSAANQISSEANVISAYGTNPFSGGLNIVGSGTVQFGDRSASATNVQDLLGVQNNYTGLTIIGDGVNTIRVDVQGQGNDNAQYTPFGTTYSWADGTIFRNNSIFEVSAKRGDGSRDNQIRFREWMQIGEQAGDQVLFDGSTARQPTLDGMLHIIGDLTFGTQGNRYGDAGTSTGNSEWLINPNEGGVFGTGNIIKMGDGNLRFYQTLREWTGDLDIREGFVSIQSYQTSMFENTGKIYFGDPTGNETTTARFRVEPRFGNSESMIDSGFQNIEVSRDIIVRDNLKQQVSLEIGYGPEMIVTYSGNVNVGNGSSVSGSTTHAQVRFYNEDTTGVNADLVGREQHQIMNFIGSLSGSNNVNIDANEGGSENDDARDIFFTVWLQGDNSSWTSLITIGADNTLFDDDDAQALRLGHANAITDNTIHFRNASFLQLGGMDRTFTQDLLFTGGAGLHTTSKIENASDVLTTITFHSIQIGLEYQDIGVGMQDGVAQAYFGGGKAALKVVKTGSGNTVLGAATGGDDVVDAFSSYTGDTEVQEGILYAGSNNSFSPYSRFNVFDNAELSVFWDQAGSGFTNTIGSLVGSLLAEVDINNSMLSFGYDGTRDADYSGVISGNSAFLLKVGTGRQRLSGNNTFSGTVGVLQETLVVGDNDSLGDPGNLIYLGGVPFVTINPIDARVELLLDGTANAIVQPLVMNAFDGNDEGITIIGTREASGTYGLSSTATVDAYQNFIAVSEGASVFNFGGSITNSGSLTKTGTGTVVLQAANSYGPFGAVPSAAVDGGTVIRHGTIAFSNQDALSGTVVELGDAHQALGTDAFVATTTSLIPRDSTATFDAASDGAGGAGNGAFIGVSNQVDGVTLTAADIGKRILVKDESNDPERNGVYEVVSVNAHGEMNLVRVGDFDEASEMIYGTSIGVTGGTQAGTRFYVASNSVATVNGDSTDPVYWEREVANPDVALLATESDMSVLNSIDVNDTNGTGKSTIGGTFATGTSEFAGDITLQHLTTPGVDNDRELTLASASNDVEGGVLFSGAITQADAGDALHVTVEGPGTVTLSNASNSWSGKTTVASGTLALRDDSTLGASPWLDIHEAATFDASAVTSGAYNYGGVVSGDGAINMGVGQTLTIEGTGVMKVGASSGPANIATAGDQIGSMEVTGNLTLAGDISGADRLVLQLGAAGAADTNDAANFSAQMGAGTYGSWFLTQGATYDSLDSGNHDRLEISGVLSVDSGSTIVLDNTAFDYDIAFGDVFNLIDWASLNQNSFDVGGDFRAGGLFGDLSLPTLSAGLIYDTRLFVDYGVLAVVPEPGRMGLFFMAAASVLLRRRRKR